MVYVNSVSIVGRLARDAQMLSEHEGQNGKRIYCALTVVTSENMKKGDEWVEVPVFHPVKLTVSEKRFAQLKKGTEVAVTGRASNYKKDDKTIYEVTADSIQVGSAPAKKAEPDPEF